MHLSRVLEGSLAPGDLGGEWCIDETRCDDVEPQATGRVGRGGRSREAFHAGACRRDGLVIRESRPGGDGRDEYDASAILQVPAGCLDAGEGRRELGRDRLVPLVGGDHVGGLQGDASRKVHDPIQRRVLVDGTDEGNRRVGVPSVELMSGFQSRDGPEGIDVPGSADHAGPPGDQAADE